MKFIKSINNNIAMCLDSKGNECGKGKGIGFLKSPCEVPLDKIERTFYDVGSTYIDFISKADPKILDIASEIIDYANFKYDNRYSSNIIFALADHIEFAIHRKNQDFLIELPLYHEIKRLYPDEMKLGEVALEMINEELEVELPEDEASCIAMHFVNYHQNSQIKDSKSVIEDCVNIIEKEMKFEIDKNGFNYARFITHLYYLIDRTKTLLLPKSDNQKMFEALTLEYPKAYKCALLINIRLNSKLNNEELLYLIIHINRLYAREDCYF